MNGHRDKILLALAKMNRAIADSSELKPSLSVILESIVEILRFDSAKLYLIDKKDNMLKGAVCAGRKETATPMEMEHYKIEKGAGGITECLFGRDGTGGGLPETMLSIPLLVYNTEIGVPLTVLGLESAGRSVWGWLVNLIKANLNIIYDHPCPAYYENNGHPQQYFFYWYECGTHYHGTYVHSYGGHYGVCRSQYRQIFLHSYNMVKSTLKADQELKITYSILFVLLPSSEDSWIRIVCTLSCLS